MHAAKLPNGIAGAVDLLLGDLPTVPLDGMLVGVDGNGGRSVGLFDIVLLGRAPALDFPAKVVEDAASVGEVHHVAGFSHSLLFSEVDGELVLLFMFGCFFVS